MRPYTHFIGVDWSGAKGKSHTGLAVACCSHKGDITVLPPALLQKHWSRFDLAASIIQAFDLGSEARLLIGIDTAFSLPYLDYGHYLPSLQGQSAVEVWQHIEDICPLDDDYYAGGFVDRYKDFLHLPYIGKGAHYERRLRMAERLCIERRMGPCESVYHLIGPSQVGMSAFSVMRMLNWVKGTCSIWPFLTRNESQVTLVEIYAALFSHMGGHKGKVRSFKDLDAILSKLGSTLKSEININNDHMTDAIITAAGLRAIAADAKYWNPASMTAKVAETEGWIFGVL
ncbi:hypothetical protein QGN29_08370 [Temperatibacter marinus]|uniref:DUF429 domain-containing protein n=1 Tax=Temperatibacter marinus TaxID=1456591 RepID=A0AA52ED99_9PROT|nr:hypothetical protein [Temperatibacter marinus]WND01573.1 hypothetical protein QGN29_08370 [Temperatibacter marinus]